MSNMICILFFPVRATSILCLLGIGVGLGSFLVYKIYSKFFPPALTPTQAPRQSTRCHHCGHKYAGHEEQDEQEEEEAQKLSSSEVT